MKVFFLLLPLTCSVNVFNNLGFMRSISMRIPHQLQGLAETGKLGSIKKQFAAESKTLATKNLVNCNFNGRSRRRKRLACRNEPFQTHFGKNEQNMIFKNIRIIINE